MERASRLLSSQTLKSVERAGVRTYHLAPGAWAAAVGRKIARHAKPVWLEDGRLVVEVEDAVWQNQLTSLRGQILSKLAAIVGTAPIQTIEFRVTPPRRGPQRVESLEPAFLDDADEIADPVMRRLYIAARRKATG